MWKTASNINIENSDNFEINPATEEKQDSIITAIDEISWLQKSTDLDWWWDLIVWTTEVEIVISWTPEAIRIQADIDNTWIIFIGKTWVLANKTNDFVRLWAWDDVILPYNDTTNALYTISDTLAQTINYWALL